MRCCSGAAILEAWGRSQRMAMTQRQDTLHQGRCGATSRFGLACPVHMPPRALRVQGHLGITIPTLNHETANYIRGEKPGRLHARAT